MPGDAVPTHSTGDLRSQSVDRKRAVESKSKWQPKWAYDGIPHVVPGPNNTERPCTTVRSQNAARNDHRTNSKYHQRAQRQRKQDGTAATPYKPRKQEAVIDDDRVVQDSGTDETLSSESDGSPPVVGSYEDKYYFDLEHGPSHGEQVLGMAVTKAVNRFKDKQTRELVRDEYDVLDEASDTEADGLAVGKGSVDDDFELL